MSDSGEIAVRLGSRHALGSFRRATSADSSTLGKPRLCYLSRVPSQPRPGRPRAPGAASDATSQQREERPMTAELTLTPAVRVKLSLMMFLQFFVWGA